MNRAELERLIAASYGVLPEYPFARDFVSAVFRHAGNRKWFSILMRVPSARLGRADGGELDVANFKCDPMVALSLRSEPGCFPAYHMNKEHWITVALDGSAADDTVRMLLAGSFRMTAGREKPHDRDL